MEHKPHQQHAEMEQERFCPTGNRRMEPQQAPSSCGGAERLAATDTPLPYRTAKSEEAPYPFQKGYKQEKTSYAL